MAKYSSLGEFQWGKAYGTSSNDVVNNIVAYENSISVSGHFSETINIEGTELVSLGNLDGFMAAYTTSGNLNHKNLFMVLVVLNMEELPILIIMEAII